jgi:hypothetical protein
VNTFKILLYGAAVFTSFSCAVLLLRGYKLHRVRLLMWSGFCFSGLTVNNVILFVDLVILPGTDLRPLRSVSALIGMLFLLYAFIWDTDEMGKPL